MEVIPNQLIKFVPSVRLCKQLPLEEFKNTEFVWFKWSLSARDWQLSTRYCMRCYEDPLYYPAPLAEELWEKLPWASVDSGLTVKGKQWFQASKSLKTEPYMFDSPLCNSLAEALCAAYLGEKSVD